MRLTDEQIDILKEKNETSLDERPLSRQECRNLIRTIEAQQQEIERLNKVLDDWKYNAKCDADHIAGLLADKDEQAGQMDYLLRRTIPILEVENNQQELIQAINAMLGGAEDGK